MPKLYAIRYTLYAKRGFTLIELLIVMAILVILAAIGIALTQKRPAQARDAIRKSDLNYIQKQLEFYKSEKGTYPTTSGWVLASAGGFWIPGLDANYLKRMPQDPKNKTANCHPRDGGTDCTAPYYNYAYYSNDFCSISGRDYILVTRLETESSSQYSQQAYNDSSGASCLNWSESSVNGLYVLSSPN